MKIINISLKLVLLISLIVALTSYIPNLEGKGMAYRTPFYLIAISFLPLLSYIKKWKNYPYATDILLILPFLLDTFGNFLGYFDSIVFFDDLLHILNWILIVMSIQTFRLQNRNFNKDDYMFGVGMGTLIIVIWELLEWILSVDGLGLITALHLSYNDTMGDLFGSVLGSFIGSYFGISLSKYLSRKYQRAS